MSNKVSIKKSKSKYKSKLKVGGAGESKKEIDTMLTEEAKLKIEKEIQKRINEALIDLEEKKQKNTNENIKTKELLDRLEIEALLNLNIIDTSNYKTNSDYLKNVVDDSNPDITRMWLMHMIGGGMLANHFIHSDGTLRQKGEIDAMILRLASWRGTNTNDSWFYQRALKKINGITLRTMYMFSFLKQFYKFIENWIYYVSSFNDKKAGAIKIASLGSTLLLINTQYIENIGDHEYLLKIPGLVPVIKKVSNSNFVHNLSYRLEHNEDASAKAIIKSIGTFSSLIIIFSIFISLYESFYYTIEREQIKKFLSEGIDATTKSHMLIFKSSFTDFDAKINKYSKNTTKEIINDLNHLHIKNQKESGWFSNANSYSKHVHEILITNLQNENIKRKEFYSIFKSKLPIVPYAIYFFNQKGEPRSVRDTICAIIIGLNNLDSKTYTELRNENIISKKRQIDLFSGGKKRTIKKYITHGKHGKHSKKNKQTIKKHKY
jgi:hypothetical protein